MLLRIYTYCHNPFCLNILQYSTQKWKKWGAQVARTTLRLLTLPRKLLQALVCCSSKYFNDATKGVLTRSCTNSCRIDKKTIVENIPLLSTLMLLNVHMALCSKNYNWYAPLQSQPPTNILAISFYLLANNSNWIRQGWLCIQHRITFSNTYFQHTVFQYCKDSITNKWMPC